MGSRGYMLDILLLLKDAGAITASAAAQVGGSNKIIDVGTCRVDMSAVIDVTAIDISSGDEFYDIIIQGSNSLSMTSGNENLAILNLGKGAARLANGCQDSVVGRYELMFTNEQFDTVFRYIRAYTVAGGTTPSINYSAFAAALPGNV